MGLNRNIIVDQDIRNFLDPASPKPRSMSANPPAFLSPTLAPTAAVPAEAVPAEAVPAEAVPAEAVPAEAVQHQLTQRDLPAPKGDDYLTRLLKYVPIEALGAYLFMAGVIDSSVTNTHDQAIWLGSLLIGILVLAILYDRVVLKIVRLTQIAMSVVGLAVYVFALGGWFATTTWYHQWYASIVVAVFAFVVAIFKLPPLPLSRPASGRTT
jgi:hypothetical protein